MLRLFKSINEKGILLFSINKKTSGNAIWCSEGSLQKYFKKLIAGKF